MHVTIVNICPSKINAIFNVIRQLFHHIKWIISWNVSNTEIIIDDDVIDNEVMFWRLLTKLPVGIPNSLEPRPNPLTIIPAA